MQITSKSLFQFFKYTIYVLLSFNVYLFFNEEFAAAAHQFRSGIEASDLIEAFVATIDTLAWVILLLMFELETYILDERHFTKVVTWSLHALRAFCYAFILYSFYGYIVNLETLFDTTPLAGVSNLCALAADQWAYATTLDQFADIGPENCASLSTASSFIQFDGMRAVVDASDLLAIRILGWVDVINAGTWLFVVLILEIDVRLQEQNRLEGFALKASTLAKVIIYSVLLLAAIYWGIAGDFVDFWDAFLWLVAFVFIELNVFEWRQESKDSAARVNAA